MEKNNNGLQGDHAPASAIISGFAKTELTQSHFRTRSQPDSLLQTSYLLECLDGFSSH